MTHILILKVHRELFSYLKLSRCEAKRKNKYYNNKIIPLEWTQNKLFFLVACTAVVYGLL